jgi:hypothetical protein
LTPTRTLAPSATLTGTPTATPAPALPDLVLRWVYFQMRGYTGGCVPRYDVELFYVCVANQGRAAAGPFTITANGEDRARVHGIPANSDLCVESGAYNFGFDPVIVVLDRYGEVTESDESNNVWDSVYPLPVPTAPPICTATPTAQPRRVYLPVLSASISLAASRPDSITIGTPPPGWVVPPAK